MENTNKLMVKNHNSGEGVTETQDNTIGKEEFDSYESVRTSGVTNMFNVALICKLSGLSREQVFYIMKHYTEIKNHFYISEAQN